MTWPLLDDLRALSAEDWWPDNDDDVEEMNFRIADETGVGRLDNDYLDGMTIPVTLDVQIEQGRWKDSPAVKWPDPKRSCGAPFLESIDAAALLEEELSRHLRAEGADVRHLHFSHTGYPATGGNDAPSVFAEIFSRGDHVSAWAKTEPVARTLAALVAGHELGIWPIHKEGTLT